MVCFLSASAIESYQQDQMKMTPNKKNRKYQVCRNVELYEQPPLSSFNCLTQPPDPVQGDGQAGLATQETSPPVIGHSHGLCHAGAWISLPNPDCYGSRRTQIKVALMLFGLESGSGSQITKVVFPLVLRDLDFTVPPPATSVALIKILLEKACVAFRMGTDFLAAWAPSRYALVPIE